MNCEEAGVKALTGESYRVCIDPEEPLDMAKTARMQRDIRKGLDQWTMALGEDLSTAHNSGRLRRIMREREPALRNKIGICPRQR